MKHPQVSCPCSCSASSWPRASPTHAGASRVPAKNAKQSAKQVKRYCHILPILLSMGFRRKGVGVAAIALALSALAFTAFGAEAIKNSACLDCHSDKTLSKTNAAGKELSLFVDVAKLAASVQTTNTCSSCH